MAMFHPLAGGRQAADDVEHERWPTCDHCGLPASCTEADLALGPRYHCPDCCWASWFRNDWPLKYHLAAEGVSP